MIRSYGLHWHVGRVYWGCPGNAGALWGSASRSPRAYAIDFRQQRGIYALYADYALVYVGQTGTGNDRLFKRLRTHRSDHLSERWNRFSWFGTQRVLQTRELSVDTEELHLSVESALNVLEAVSISISEPRLNLQRGRWSEATQYYQWWEREDENEGAEEDQ